MRRLISRFFADDGGATAIEYGLIASLVFLVALGAVTAFGSASTTMFNTALNAISAAVGI
ncbi:MAG: Flp family type IVb pilin [Alphaproteobacteria bacterium]|nr:MAG: Flp family type IVb pilin [Alphaproteobacteria bacterium]